MQNTNNTVLITGGGSGIGLELARVFLRHGNKVIITGRNEQKLKDAAAELGQVYYIPGDVTDEFQMDALVAKILSDFPELNVLVNNAGAVNYYHLGEQSGDFEKAKQEIKINYLAPVRLIEKLLPILNNKPSAAILNISSIAAYSPGRQLPTYSASKAALHSYTQILRLTLAEKTKIKVFEALPPLTDTAFAAPLTREKMSPVTVAEEIMACFEIDHFEIRVGSVAKFYKLLLRSPADALLVRNGLKTYEDAMNGH